METKNDSRAANQENKTPSPHPPTDHNPYPYPLQQPNRRGWIKALIALVVVAVVVTLFCVVIGVFDHNEKSLEKEYPVETVEVNP